MIRHKIHSYKDIHSVKFYYTVVW